MTAVCTYLAADAYMVCLTHALSTEREEVMGLCIGEVSKLIYESHSIEWIMNVKGI